jgi:hypothetical protein
MKKVVIYPGRFQPMLWHHAEVFKQLQRQFPDAEVYVGTSSKVEPPRSPFSFEEKKLIAAEHGVPDDRVLPAARPYHKDDYTQYFDENNTLLIFAVGEKDLDRFPFDNVDPDTGLDMTRRGIPRPKYYQSIDTFDNDTKPMSVRGYVTVVPNVTCKAGTGEVSCASDFRNAIKYAPDRESAIEIYLTEFDRYNEQVFNLIYNKITNSETDMKSINEQINQLKKLAGLPLHEAAPVSFRDRDQDDESDESDESESNYREYDPRKVKLTDPNPFQIPASANPRTVEFTDPSKSSATMSIANRFPDGTGPWSVNDLKTKQKVFFNELISSPASLLSEINERIKQNDNGVAVSSALGRIVDFMINSRDTVSVTKLPENTTSFLIALVANATKNMLLVAGDTSKEYRDDDDDVMIKDSVDLSQIREMFNDNYSEPSEEVKQVLAQVGTGDLDIYEVLVNPRNPAEQQASKIIQSMYDDAVTNFGLHPDDDVDEILDKVQDKLEIKYSQEAPEEFTSPGGVRWTQSYDGDKAMFVIAGTHMFSMPYDQTQKAFDTQEAEASDPAVEEKLKSMEPIANNPDALGRVIDELMKLPVRAESKVHNRAGKKVMETRSATKQRINTMDKAELARLIHLAGIDNRILMESELSQTADGNISMENYNKMKSALIEIHTILTDAMLVNTNDMDPHRDTVGDVLDNARSIAVKALGAELNQPIDENLMNFLPKNKEAKIEEYRTTEYKFKELIQKYANQINKQVERAVYYYNKSQDPNNPNAEADLEEAESLMRSARYDIDTAKTVGGADTEYKLIAAGAVMSKIPLRDKFKDTINDIKSALEIELEEPVSNMKSYYNRIKALLNKTK